MSGKRLAVLCVLSAATALARPEVPATGPSTGASPATTASGLYSPTGTVTEKLSVTTDRIRLPDGAELKYRATAGNLLLKDDAGKVKASFFFTAYERETERAALAERPITFVFNGGPGAASVWLHLGTAGPRRVVFDEGGEPVGPPYKLAENPDTWLASTDVVFIDPVGTGYSRPGTGEKGDQFYGVDQDVASVGEFVRLYTTQYGRWASPKFLAGESYGTTRAAALAEYLHDRLGIAVNGIVLVSTVLDFGTIRPARGNDVGYALFLPTYAATAHYHKRLAADLQARPVAEVLREAERFALDELHPALVRGDAVPAERRRELAGRLARLTGLDANQLERSGLRIDPAVFMKALLAGDRKVVGRMDARLTGFDLDAQGKWPDFDPALSRALPAYAATFNDYARKVLKYESDLEYEVLSDRVHPWDWGKAGVGYLNVTEALRSTMAKQPRMRVFVASGLYDLATPYFATEYTMNQLDLSEELRRNLTLASYPGGHMMYHVGSARVKLGADVNAFVRDSAKVPATRPGGEGRE